MAVVPDGENKQAKGYSPPEDDLARGLAKYFESRTEIENSVLIDKMKEVSEGQILKLLGIKQKEDESPPKEKENDDKLTPEDKKEAENFLAELQEQAKAEKAEENNEIDEAEEQRKKQALKQLACKEKKLAENKQKNEIKPKKEEENSKPKVKTPIKSCSVDMGRKVPNRSPIKVYSSTDSDCMILSDSNSKMEKRKEEMDTDQLLNLSKNKNSNNNTNAASVSLSGVYFSDSEDF